MKIWPNIKGSVVFYPFRNLGSINYAHIQYVKMNKFDDKVRKCIFLCVNDQSKSYKLSNPLIEKIVDTKDVTFDEENTWDWNVSQPTQDVLIDDAETNQFSSPVDCVISPLFKNENKNRTLKFHQQL